MREEQGTVIGTADKLAQIKVGRHSDCSGCGGCSGSRNLILEAVNDLGAKNGDRVRFVLQEERMLLAAFVVFVLPLLLAAVGGFIGYRWSLTGEVWGSEATFCGAALFFLLGLLCVKWYDRRVEKSKAAKPRIVAVMR
ncbi:MAG: SoxR reducing system RseC family protein [Selenomonadaceae bacterium]|nr:SoxR reducing system RseC family protein [Selenomonadaceae bacterium]